jgi:hypothetical protein
MTSGARVPDLRFLVDLASAPSPWDLGNEVLYTLCRDHPAHKNPSVVIAKVWLIGRAHAAVIERRRGRHEASDSFYIESVAVDIMRSGIDEWIEEAKEKVGRGESAVTQMLATHAKVTQLFEGIAGLNKRSLASKYLHFHVPSLFFIYDTRAAEGVRVLAAPLGRTTGGNGDADSEYRRFVEKCVTLQGLIEGRLAVRLSPRQLDNLLLHVHACTC